MCGVHERCLNVDLLPWISGRAHRVRFQGFVSILVALLICFVRLAGVNFMALCSLALWAVLMLCVLYWT